jgi:ComF family protein
MCLDCVTNPLPVDWCAAYGIYEGVLEKLLQAMKYERHDFLDQTLATLLEETLRTRGDLAFDALVPVPMHPAKERRRGYNQSDLLARALAPHAGIPVRPLLAKKLDRGRQASLTRRERVVNVRNTFAATGAEGLSILLIDDICTTGETLRACAKELLARGAKRVCALTVAKAS